MYKDPILTLVVPLTLAFCGLTGTLTGATGSTQTSTPQSLSEDAVWTRACLSAVDPRWSQPERRVWDDLCHQKTADLSPGQHLEPNAMPLTGCGAMHAGKLQLEDRSAYANDPRRRLSGEFLQEILGKAKFARYVRDRPIRIVGAFITKTHIDDANFESLSLDNSLIDDIQFTDTKIGSWLSFCSSQVKQGLLLSNVTAPRVDLYRVGVEAPWVYQAENGPCVHIEGSTISKLSVVNVEAANIELWSSHFDGYILVNANKIVRLDVSNQTNAYAIMVHGTTLSSLALSQIDITRALLIGGNQWREFPASSKHAPESIMTISQVSAPVWEHHPGKSLPDTFFYGESVFGSVFLGENPLALLEKMDKDPESALDLYALAAKTYLARGRLASARVISYRREVLEDQAEAKRAGNGNGLRWINRVVVGYGYYPERGLVILLGFVIVGWPIFASGEKKMLRATRPRSWLVFTFDTMIPIIELDPKSAEVEFRGSRQYYLYLMRLLGAALAFLVFAYLKQTFVGPG